MIDLTPEQIAVLERLQRRGFVFIAFPLYASKIGVRKGNCAALLDPVAGGLRIFGEACYLVDGNLSVQVTQGRKKAFVWKKSRVEATPERLAEVAQFAEELEELLLASA